MEHSNNLSNKMIYKIEKSIPSVVQRILEEMGFEEVIALSEGFDTLASFGFEVE